MTMTLTAAPKAWISALLAKMVMVMVTSHGHSKSFSLVIVSIVFTSPSMGL